MQGNLSQEISNVSGASYHEIFKRFRELSTEYGNLPMSSLISAYNASNSFGLGNMYTPNPMIQNRRIKGIATRPGDFSKNQVAAFIQKPDNNEKNLRAVEKGLEYTAYPMYHTRTVYQNLLSYHNYIAPHLSNKSDAKRDDFWREWKLVEKLRCAINPKDKAHEFAGRALQEGKIFVVPRISVDKAHNSVNYAFLQRLPSDWIKIVGYNNISKYTVSFNMMYFCEPGTSWEFFGDLFEPYLNNWAQSLSPMPMISGKKVVFAKKTGINLQKVREAASDNVEIYNQNGRWFYWVTLPVDRVFPMEIDDTEDNVLPPFTGLFLDMIQLSEMEQIQLEILQNPLVSILTGEMETWNERNNNSADEYKISDAGRRFFLDLWYEMLALNNTSGIGLYAAPFKNMRLETLDEAPNATNIVSAGYRDLMSKAGLTALIPVSDEARAGAVNVSLAIESRFPQTIYTCFERMMNVVIARLNLKYTWKFRMFGSIAEDEKLEKRIESQETLGKLSAAIISAALYDMSFLDDIALSDIVIESEIMKKRIPLVSSFNQSAKTVGRPPEENAGSSDGHEGDIDSPTE